MNAGNVILLNEWVKENQGWILENTPTQTALAEKAAKELRFKVPTGPLCQVLKHNGLPTRRPSKMQAEKEALVAKLMVMTDYFIKTLGCSQIPQWLLDDLRQDSRLPNEVREAVPIKTLMIG